MKVEKGSIDILLLLPPMICSFQLVVESDVLNPNDLKQRSFFQGCILYFVNPSERKWRLKIPHLLCHRKGFSFDKDNAMHSFQQEYTRYVLQQPTIIEIQMCPWNYPNDNKTATFQYFLLRPITPPPPQQEVRQKKLLLMWRIDWNSLFNLPKSQNVYEQTTFSNV